MTSHEETFAGIALHANVPHGMPSKVSRASPSKARHFGFKNALNVDARKYKLIGLHHYRFSSYASSLSSGIVHSVSLFLWQQHWSFCSKNNIKTLKTNSKLIIIFFNTS